MAPERCAQRSVSASLHGLHRNSSGHLIELVERIESKCIERQAVVLAETDLRPGKVDPREDVIVLYGLILAVHAQGDDDIRLKACVEANLPAQASRNRCHAASDADGYRKLAVHRQEMGCVVPIDIAAELGEFVHGGG